MQKGITMQQEAKILKRIIDDFETILEDLQALDSFDEIYDAVELALSLREELSNAYAFIADAE